MFADLSLRIPGGSKSLHKYAGVKFWAEAGLAKGTTVGVGSQYEGWSAYMVQTQALVSRTTQRCFDRLHLNSFPTQANNAHRPL